MGIIAITRQIPRTSKVKRMRDFNSGILKQFANVLAMAAIMQYPNNFGYFLGRGVTAFSGAGAGFAIEMTWQEPPLPSIFAFADALKACAVTVSFLVSSPSPRIFTPAALPFARPAFCSDSKSTRAPSSKRFSESRLTGMYRVV